MRIFEAYKIVKTA